MFGGVLSYIAPSPVFSTVEEAEIWARKSKEWKCN